MTAKVTRFPRRMRSEPVFIAAAIHPDVSAGRLTHALTSQGLAVSNLPDGTLLIHECPEYRRTGEVPNGEPVPSFLQWPAGPDSPQ
jgi:hypothetical protein